MQATTASVVFVAELTAGVQRRQDDLQRRLLHLRMFVDRNATTIVADRATAAVLVQCDHDAAALAGQKLVDRVVHDLPQQVMQPARIDSADVHRGPFSNGLQAFQDLNIAGCVS